MPGRFFAERHRRADKRRQEDANPAKHSKPNNTRLATGSVPAKQQRDRSLAFQPRRAWKSETTLTHRRDTYHRDHIKRIGQIWPDLADQLMSSR